MKIFAAACLLLFQLNAQSQDGSFFFTTSDSVSLYVRTTGAGQPCIFVHGGPGSTSLYFEATTSAALLAKKLQLIYYDQRGSGRSGSPRNKDFSLPRMLQDLEELRRHLGYKKWAVMGHSFGGIIATQYAKDHPASVSKLLLVNSTLYVDASLRSQVDYGLQKIRPADEAPYRDTSVSVSQRVNLIMALLNSKGLGYTLMFRNKYEKMISDSVNALLPAPNRDFGRAVWGFPAYFSDLSLLTPSIKMPVLVITGDQDHAIGSDHYLSFRFPSATIVHYIGGHLPFQEEPQWFSEQVIRFLRMR